MRIGASGASVMQTPEESDARWAEVLGGLPADYDHSVLHTVDVMLTSATSAWVTVDCGRFNTHGAVVASWNATPRSRGCAGPAARWEVA